MPAFFIVLFKINLGLALFAIAYYVILRRLTFYTLNRAFLVFGILFSTAYPFINLTDFFRRQTRISQKIVNFVPDINQQATSWTWISILFWTGVAVMTTRLIIQFVSLRQLHKRSTPGFIDNLPVRIMSEPLSPFSFWRNIYINPGMHKATELNNILAHENVHVREWHTLDIILAELSVVFYWFNPGVWLIKKAVKENLEFITDEKVLRKGIDKKTYQYSLLEVGNLKNGVPIANSFTLSGLKNRIKMMNVKRSSRLTLSRYFLVLPVLVLITLVFTVSGKETKRVLLPIRQAFVPADNTPTSNTESTDEKTTEQTGQLAKVRNERPARSSHKINTATGFQLPPENQPGGTMPGVTDTSVLSSDNFDDPSVKTVIGRRTVKGINLDTVTSAVPPNPASIADEKPVITVMGYPTQKRKTKTDSISTTSAVAPRGNTEEMPYKVVTGYRSPRAAEKPKN